MILIDLPNEVILNILEYVSIECVNFALVNHLFYNLFLILREKAVENVDVMKPPSLLLLSYNMGEGDLYKKMEEACVNNNVNYIQYFKKKYWDKISSSWKLYLAVCMEDHYLIEKLVNDEEVPLEMGILSAVRYQKKDIFDKLFSNDRIYMSDILRPLKESCKFENLEYFKRLFEYALKIEENDTPFHYIYSFQSAAKHNNKKILDLLISYGEPISEWLSEGLVGACQSNNKELIKYIINKSKKYCIENWPGEFERNMYVGFCKGGHYEAINNLKINYHNKCKYCNFIGVQLEYPETRSINYDCLFFYIGYHGHWKLGLKIDQNILIRHCFSQGLIVGGHNSIIKRLYLNEKKESFDLDYLVKKMAYSYSKITQMKLIASALYGASKNGKLHTIKLFFTLGLYKFFDNQDFFPLLKKATNNNYFLTADYLLNLRNKYKNYNTHPWSRISYWTIVN